MTFWVAGSIVVGGLLQSDASNNASDAASAASGASNALQKYQYDTTRADNQPLLDTRNAALGHINALMQNPGYNVQQDPGYKFMFDQGTKALGSHAAANGSYFSGATLKDLTKFGEDYAGTKYTDILNRYNAAAGLGQAATSANALAGANYANGVGANLTGLSNVQGANALNQGNIWSNGINQLGAYGGRNGWFNSGQVGGGTFSGIDPYGQLGGPSSAGDYSDIRLKTNIVRIGTTARGFNAYSWDWKDGSGSAVGVIAQEVQAVDPSAVTADESGFLMVDYSRV
jgi:hypothetical protein